MMALTAVTTSLASAAMVLGLVCLRLPRYAGGRFPLAGSPFLNQKVGSDIRKVSLVLNLRNLMKY